jgi:ABC-type multidrug transport system fused ATPase/permease subunit
MEQSNKLLNDIEKINAAQMVWRLLKSSEKRRLLIIFFMTLVGTVLEMFGLGMVVPLVSVLTKPDYVNDIPLVDKFFGELSSSQAAIWTMSLLVAIYMLKTIFLVWKTWVQRGYSNEVSTRIGQDLFENYMRQPYSFHLEHNSAIMIRNSQNSGAVMGGVVDPILFVASEILVTGGLFVLMLVVEPVASVTAVVVFGTFTWLFRRFTTQRISRWGKAQNFHNGMIVKHLQEGFGGVKDVKMLGREDFFIADYQNDLRGNAYVQRRYNFAQSLPRYGMELLTIICLGVLITLMVLSGRQITNVLPVLALFGAAAFRLLPTMNQVISSFMSISLHRPILVNLYDDLCRDFPMQMQAKEENRLIENLSVERLKFKYANVETFALEDVSIIIRRGEAVGLIGSSGSGKSTLVDILMGLLEPTAGHVLVDGDDIHDNIRGWQDQIGYVPQSIFLTDDTLLRNVAFGLPKDQIDHDAVKSAIRSAQLEEFVASLPDGLDTVVGERGVRLSGGQRQRIGIARALYNNPDVLVLDEATSSLDTETEHGVMQAVQALQGEKTVIIVAHRLSTVEYCDRLYRLENARIVDEGTFSEVTSRTNDLPREN